MARDTYTPTKDWQDKPDKTTPILAEDLKHIETGIKEAKDNRALKELYDDRAINLGRQSGSAVGDLSTAEGNGTTASAQCSHAEGQNTTASGYCAHAEGFGPQATGYCSHAEGYDTKAEGQESHAEGFCTTAKAVGAHAEGQNTQANESCTHAEGQETIASGYYAHAEGSSTKASGNGAHAEGNSTAAVGGYTHAEGNATKAYGYYSHAEGNNTTAGHEARSDIEGAHAEGSSTVAAGSYSHAEGYQTKAHGNYSHAEGYNTTAGYEGANGYTSSHAEGYGTTAGGPYCHAEGYGAIAGRNPGVNTVHAEGYYTIGSSNYQHVQGKYNVEDTAGQYAHIVGNGADEENRSNAHTLDWKGNAYYAGDVENGAGVTMNALMDEINKLKVRMDALGDGSGGNNPSDVEIVPWADGTNAQIAAMAQALRDGTISIEDTGWEVGQERTVQLSAIESENFGNHAEQTQTLVILHKGGKLLENGNECSFVVGLKDCLAKGNSREGFGMNESDTNLGGWDGCRMRTGCNDDFIKMIPQYLRPAFAKFQNITADGVGETTKTSIDLFALPAEKEVFGTNIYASSTAESELFQFEYYATYNNRIKKAGNNGAQIGWWERSPSAKEDTKFCIVYSQGEDNHYDATFESGLSPFGCI